MLSSIETLLNLTTAKAIEKFKLQLEAKKCAIEDFNEENPPEDF
jgi:hypothetical protein